MCTSHNKRTILLSKGNICKGNRTEWSPTRSAIIRTEFDDRKSCYQLIKGFRLQLTVRLHCALATVQNDFRKMRLQIIFEEFLMIFE